MSEARLEAMRVARLEEDLVVARKQIADLTAERDKNARLLDGVTLLNRDLEMTLSETIADHDALAARIEAAVAWLDDPDCGGELPRRDVRDLRRIILGQPPYPAALSGATEPREEK